MASELTVGGRAKFLKYAEQGEGFQPILPEGQMVEITKSDENGFVVVAINDNGERLDTDGNVLVEGGKPMADQVWAEELEAVETPVPEPEPLPTVEKAKGKGRGKAKAAEATPAAAPQTAAEKKAAAAAAKKKAAEDKKAEAAAAKAKAAADKKAAADAAKAAAKAAKEAAAAPVVKEISENLRTVMGNHDAVTTAKELIKQGERTDYDLGEVLQYIRASGVYKQHGFEGKKGFEEFCIRELDIQYRKAMYLIDIFSTFDSLGIDKARIEAIGWSKAKELCRIGADQLSKDMDVLLDFAGKHTKDELITHIRENYKVSQRAERVKVTTFSFKVVESEAETVTKALDHAKTITGEDDINKSFLHICGDWMNTAAGSDLDLEGFLTLGLSRFGAEEVMAALEAKIEAMDAEQENDASGGDEEAGEEAA